MPVFSSMPPEKETERLQKKATCRSSSKFLKLDCKVVLKMQTVLTIRVETCQLIMLNIKYKLYVYCLWNRWVQIKKKTET